MAECSFWYLIKIFRWRLWYVAWLFSMFFHHSQVLQLSSLVNLTGFYRRFCSVNLVRYIVKIIQMLIMVYNNNIEKKRQEVKNSN